MHWPAQRVPRATADVLIVGAGIAGASVAYELGTTRDVILLEAEDQPGYHATGRSAAFFSETYGNATIRAMTAASRGFFERPPAGFCESPLLTPRDCLTLARHDELPELDARFAGLRDVTDGVSLESADFALERVPVLRPSAVARCLWEAGGQRIDVHALLQGYLRGFRRGGGRLVTAARALRARRDRGAWSVETTAGPFRADVIVNAAGAWADEVALACGARSLNLQPLKRTACLIESETPVDVGDWAAVTDLAESFYFMPEAGQLLLSPADETPAAPGDVYPDDLDIALAVDRFESATTLRVRRVTHQWAGLRTFAPDRTPVVGFDPVADGFFWLAGQGGYGIQTAPALARLAAALAGGASPPADLRGIGSVALRPGRLTD